MATLKMIGMRWGGTRGGAEGVEGGGWLGLPWGRESEGGEGKGCGVGVDGSGMEVKEGEGLNGCGWVKAKGRKGSVRQGVGRGHYGGHGWGVMGWGGSGMGVWVWKRKTKREKS